MPCKFVNEEEQGRHTKGCDEGFDHLQFEAKRDRRKEPTPEISKGERLSRGKPEAGEGIEEMNVEKGHKNDNEPPHYFLRRVKRRLVFRTRVLRPLAD